EVARLGDQLLAVGQQDIAPDGRITGGYAGEIPKPRAGEGEEIGAFGLVLDRAHQRERQQVRQVADGRIGRVVALGRHALDLATQRAPDAYGLVHVGGQGALDGGEDDLAPTVELGIGVFDASELLAGDGVGRHEHAHLLPQHTARGIDHLTLGGADVHDEDVVAHQ